MTGALMFYKKKEKKAHNTEASLRNALPLKETDKGPTDEKIYKKIKKRLANETIFKCTLALNALLFIIPLCKYV